VPIYGRKMQRGIQRNVLPKPHRNDRVQHLIYRKKRMKTLLIFLWQRGFRLFKNDTNATPVKGWFLNVEAGT
jgi:hypothetical protein